MQALAGCITGRPAGSALKHFMLRCFVWIHSSFLLTKVQAMMLNTWSCCAAASLVSENEDFCSTCLEGYNTGRSPHAASPFQLHHMLYPPMSGLSQPGLEQHL